jgi:hypothetical protein
MSGFLIVTGLVGLAIGIWLGLPGRYTQSSEDIEQIMESGVGRRGRRKRVFTPIAWMQRNASAKDTASRGRRRGGGRSGFKLESPKDD